MKRIFRARNKMSDLLRCPSSKGPHVVLKLRCGLSHRNCLASHLILLRATILFCTLLIFPFHLYATVVDRVVAIVNDEVITLYDLDRAMTTSPLKQERPEDLRRRILEKLIDQKLLEQEMKKSKVEVTKEEMARAIAAVLSRNRISIEQLQMELANKGITFEAFKKQLEEEVRQAKFIQQNLASQVQLNSQEVKEFQNRNKNDFDGASVRIGWVFTPLERGMNAKEKRKLVLRTRKLVDEARKASDFKSFVELKQREEKGVETGEWSKLLKDLPLAMVPTVQEMMLGSVSDPIATPEGIYVVKLYEKSGGGVTSEKVLDEEAIREQLYQEKLDQEIQNYVLRLRRKAYVEIKE